MQLLAQHDVREYWLVDPDTVRIEVYGLRGDHFLISSTSTGTEFVHSPLLPELELRPTDVVPDPAA